MSCVTAAGRARRGSGEAPGPALRPRPDVPSVKVVEERRAPRVGTISGLALLVGGTVLVAATRGAHSVFAAGLLGLLAAGLAHALLDEIRRQARRRPAGGWAAADTINTVLLAGWSVVAATAGALLAAPAPVRVALLVIALGYALSCAYFAAERRRAVRRLHHAAIEAEPADAH